MTGLAPATLALSDAILAATGFGSSLYGGNSFVIDFPTFMGKVRLALEGGGERYPVDRELTHNYGLVGLRTVPLQPGTPRRAVDALLAAAVPAVAACDLCPWPSTAPAGLLPVPAGAVVVGLILCEECWTPTRRKMPRAHFIPARRGLS